MGLFPLAQELASIGVSSMIACAEAEPKATSGRFGLLGAILGVVLYFGVLRGVFWGFATFLRFVWR